MTLTRRSLIAGGVAGAPAVLQARNAAPNILLILSDDHSYPYLGCYGADWISTPNLDDFAGQGMRFTRAFTAAPQCVPSRAAIMTGQSPVAVRMGRFSAPLPPDVVTLPEVLMAAGYFTGVCGRYFHLDGIRNPGPVTSAIYEKHNLRTWQRRVNFIDVCPQEQTSGRFEQFLSQAPKGRPWFMWMNYSDPHHPWDGGPRSIDTAKVRVPRYLPDLPGIRQDLARYSAEIERMDSLFGQTIDILASRNVAGNTLVIFMGDNGMAFPHGKGSLYDPGVRVPLIARWPGRIGPGASSALVSGVDIAPTLIQAAGGSPPAEMSGVSFLPLLLGLEHSTRRHVFAARLHHGNAPFTPETTAAGFDLSRSVRSERWKLIYNCTPQMRYAPVDSAADPGWQQMLAAHREGRLSPAHERAYFGRPRPVFELYDTERDPGELTNLYGRRAVREVQRSLLVALQERMILDQDFLPPPMDE